MKCLHSVATTFVSLFVIFVSINFTGASKAATITYDLTVVPIVGISSGTGVLSVNGPVGPGLTSFGVNDPNVVALTFTFGSTTFDLKNDVGASYGPITFFDGQLSSIKASDFLLPPAVSSTAVLLIGVGGDVTYVGPTSQDFSAGIIVAELRETPIPGALPLFATGLGAFGLLGWRRKRKAKPAGAKGQFINRVAVSSTMGPGVKVEPASVLGSNSAQ